MTYFVEQIGRLCQSQVKQEGSSQFRSERVGQRGLGQHD